MSRRRPARPRPPRSTLRSTVSPKGSAARGSRPPAKPAAAPRRPPARAVGHLIDPGEATLLDVIDNLLSKGVVLNADIILALADVDLVYLRLSALLCAADRVMPR
jgi:hypothetical protein